MVYVKGVGINKFFLELNSSEENGGCYLFFSNRENLPREDE